MSHKCSDALDHVVLVLFENRSLDNVLGHLYGPDDGKTFFFKFPKKHQEKTLLAEYAGEDASRR